jgi:putative flippase GtrA
MTRFGLVGVLGLLVDVALFNLIRALLLDGGHAVGGVLVAKSVSTVCAIGVNWLGNRWWAFRHERRTDVAREAASFFAVSLLGSLVGLLCLWCSHDVLDLRSALDDNLSANVVGLALGSAVRFTLSDRWVWRRPA